VVSGLATVLVLVVLHEPDRRCPKGPPDSPAVVAVLGQHPKRCDRAPTTARSGGWNTPVVRRLLGATFVMFLALNLFFASFPLHASTALGWDPVTLGWFFTLLACVMFVAQGPILDRMSARMSSGAVFAVGIACLTLAFVAYLSTWTPALLAGAALFALGNGLAWPTFQARLAEVAPAESQGAVQGAATSAGSLAAILGLLVGGLIYPYLGTLIFACTAALFVLLGAGTPIWFGPATDAPTGARA
jgi:MFS family permease